MLLTHKRILRYVRGAKSRFRILNKYDLHPDSGVGQSLNSLPARKAEIEPQERLRQLGVKNSWPAVPSSFSIETPSDLGISHISGHLEFGAFSYVVSGFLNLVSVGRYCSIGEAVQLGRGPHPTNWLSSSPFQYERGFVEHILSNTDFSDRHKHVNTIQFVPKYLHQHWHRVVIGNDVWIGHGAFVKSGVKIGDGAIIGACSVVTKDVEPFTIVGGNPARIIRLRFPEKIVERLVQLQWWNYALWDFDHVDWNDPEIAAEQIGNLASSNAIRKYKPMIITPNTLSEM